MSIPALIPEIITARTVSVKVKILEPAAVSGISAVLLNILELREISSYMIENTVKNNSYAVFVESAADFLE